MKRSITTKRKSRYKQRNIKEVFVQAKADSLSEKELVPKDLDYISALEFKGRNPDKMLNDKGELLTLYDTMMFDDTINSAVNLKKRMILGVECNIEPASDDPGDIEVKEFVEKALWGMEIKLYDALDNMLDALVYGNKLAEKVWKYKDGKMILDKLKFRHSILFDFDYDTYGNLTKLKIGASYGSSLEIIGYENIMGKFLIFVMPYLKDGNWWGQSELKELYQKWYSKTYINKWRDIYIQNYGQPILDVGYDSMSVKQTELAEMEDFLDNLQDNLYLMNPAIRGPNGEMLRKFDIKAIDITGSQTGTDKHERAIDQIDKQIKRKLLIPDKIGYTESPGGAYNMAEKQFDAFVQVIENYRRRIEDTVDQQIIKYMVDYNFTVDDYPEFKFQKMNDQIASDMLRVLVDTEIIDPQESWIRSRLGIPDIDEKEQAELEKAKVEKARKWGVPMIGKPNPIKSGENEKNKEEYARKSISQVVDHDEIKKNLSSMEDDFVEGYNATMSEQEDYIIKQIQRKGILESKNLADFKTVQMKKTDLKNLVSQYLAKVYLFGKTNALDQNMKRIKKAMGPEAKEYFSADDYIDEGIDWLDREWVDKFLKEYGELGNLTQADKEYLRSIRTKAFYITGDIEDRVLKQAYNIITQGLKDGTMAKDIVANLKQTLPEDREKYAITIARTNESDAFNIGAMNMYNSDILRPLIEGYMYDAIMDDVTTDFCASQDGRFIPADDPMLPRITPPNHFNCRSQLLPIFVGEGDNEESYFYGYEDSMKEINRNLQPAKGFGGK